MPLDPDAQAFLNVVARQAERGVALTPASARAQQRQRTAWAIGAPEPIADVYDTSIPTSGRPIDVRVYVPRVASIGLPMLAFFHGGGWMTCGLESHDVMCRAIAKRADCIVVSVDYPLAPEHPFPEGLDACWQVTTWLSRNAGDLGGDPTRLAVGGDSAGGNLAAVVSLRAKQAGLALSMQLLLYPLLDYRLDSPADPRTPTSHGLSVEALRFYYENYVPDGASLHAPEISPFQASDLSGVAPAYVVTCEFDPCLPEAEDYASRLVCAGVPVTSRRYFGQIHGFIRATGVITESWSAITHIAHALRGAFQVPLSLPGRVQP